MGDATEAKGAGSRPPSRSKAVNYSGWASQGCGLRMTRMAGTTLTTAPPVPAACSPSSPGPTSWTRSPRSTTSWAPLPPRPSPSSSSKCPVAPRVPWGSQGARAGAPQSTGVPAAAERAASPSGPQGHWGALCRECHRTAPTTPLRAAAWAPTQLRAFRWARCGRAASGRPAPPTPWHRLGRRDTRALSWSRGRKSQGVASGGPCAEGWAAPRSPRPRRARRWQLPGKLPPTPLR